MAIEAPHILRDTAFEHVESRYNARTPPWSRGTTRELPQSYESVEKIHNYMNFHPCAIPPHAGREIPTDSRFYKKYLSLEKIVRFVNSKFGFLFHLFTGLGNQRERVVGLKFREESSKMSSLRLWTVGDYQRHSNDSQSKEQTTLPQNDCVP